MTYILGLTGSIATGKSTVSRLFKEYGFPIVDADVGARAVVEIGTPGLKAVVDFFGVEILQENGELDRAALGKKIFADKEKRTKLNDLLKPYIRQWIAEQKNNAIEAKVPLVILDIPLLYEANYQEMMDEVMVVAVSQDVQLERLMKRDKRTRDEALQRIHSQMSIEEKVSLADCVIDNNGSFLETKEQVLAWLKKKNFLTS